jgi:hypothetical protein
MRSPERGARSETTSEPNFQTKSCFALYKFAFQSAVAGFISWFTMSPDFFQNSNLDPSLDSIRLKWHKLQPVKFGPCKAKLPQAKANAT